MNKIGKNVIIDCPDQHIGDNVTIKDGTIIRTKYLRIGFGSVIEENCKILCESFQMGDNSFIGHDSKILVPQFKCGDYVELHNHLFCNGEQPCTIGCNVWIGQNCILNARAELIIGNGVGIGTYSMVWTHGMHGELLEGCLIYKVAPVVIEDDVWLIGSFNVIATGLTLGKKSTCLSGSMITKNIPAGTVWAGNPARDISDKIKAYKEVTIEDKFAMMKSFVEEFYAMCPEYKNFISFTEVVTDNDIDAFDSENMLLGTRHRIIITKRNMATKRALQTTVFDLATKQYNKELTPLEIAFIKSLLYEKARFLPIRTYEVLGQ